MQNINEIPKNIYDRLEYLEFMLRFRGWISRADLTERFGISGAAASRDISLYREIAEDNLLLNQSTKKYEILDTTFSPLFNLKIQSVLSKIRTSKISTALNMNEFDGVLCPPRLSLPKIDVLSAITRAISGKHSLIMTYFSIQNGFSTKSIHPHAIFDNGIHWYVRAFDKKRALYHSYALTRIDTVEIDFNSDNIQSSVGEDDQWNRMVILKLVPHPNKNNVKYPKTVEHDFNMVHGCLQIKVRATVAGYWLSQWRVDCTENHSLKGYEYQLWLQNHNTLYDVESRKIAPGLSTYEKDFESS